MQNQENSRIFYGGFFVRLAAAWVDALLVSLALLTFRLPLLFAGDANPLHQPVLFRFTPWDIFLYLLTTAYYVFFTYAAGATLGKRMFSLRVVAADGRSLSLWDVIYRETIGKYLSGVFLFMGYIMAGVDKEKKAFHDMLADTRVIYSFGKEPRNRKDYYCGSEKGYPVPEYGYKKVEEEKPDSQETQTEEENGGNSNEGK